MKWLTHPTSLVTGSPGTLGILVSGFDSGMHLISHCYSSATMVDGLRPSETAIEDVFIRKFMTGTFHSLLGSEVIIKRQHNMIRVAFIIRQAISPRKVYFLIGYCEELLSYWIQCPVKLEIQTIADRKDVVFKYI